MTRWAAALSSLLLLAVVACTASPREAPPDDADADLVSIRTSAQLLYERFAGSSVDRDAVEVLTAYRNNGGTAECLARRGFPGWDWAALRLTQAGRDALGFDPPWGALPHRGRWSAQALAQASFRRAEILANDPPPRPGLDAAVGVCIGHRPARLGQARSHAPGAVMRLQLAWIEAVTGATARFGSVEDYSACMTDQHIPLLDGRPYGTGDRLYEVFDRALPRPAEVPVGNEPAGAAWTRFLALEGQVTDADWQCREATYPSAVRAVEPVVESFAADHAADLRRVSAYWNEMHRRAMALGWDERTGLIDLGVVGPPMA